VVAGAAGAADERRRMIGELDFLGIFLSPLLPALFLALAIGVMLRRLLRRRDFYRFVWHPALFDFSCFVLLLGLVLGAGSVALGSGPALWSLAR
jgi:hypothetical protein